MSYLMANQPTEVERLQVQSRVWEPVGAEVLQRLGDGTGLRVLDVGCGAMGWLPLLARWVGPSGSVVGSDIDDLLLAAARAFCASEALSNVTVVHDDFAATTLAPESFDVVHLRFELAPLGRAMEQVTTAYSLAKPGGIVILEESEANSWAEYPPAPSVAHLRSLIVESFARAGGDFNAGRRLPEYLRRVGISPQVRATCLALEPGHPYLFVPLQFARSLRPRLLGLMDEAALDQLEERAAADLRDPERWGITFTLVQAWGRRPA